jgi:hypothetical protein
MIIAPSVQDFIRDPYHYILVKEGDRLTAAVARVAGEHLISKADFNQLISLPEYARIGQKIRLFEATDPSFTIDPAILSAPRQEWLVDVVLESDAKRRAFAQGLFSWVEEEFGSREYLDRVSFLRMVTKFILEEKNPERFQIHHLRLTSYPQVFIEFLADLLIYQEANGQLKQELALLQNSPLLKKEVMEVILEKKPMIRASISSWIENKEGNLEQEFRVRLKPLIEEFLTVNPTSLVLPDEMTAYPDCLIEKFTQGGKERVFSSTIKAKSRFERIVKENRVLSAQIIEKTLEKLPEIVEESERWICSSEDERAKRQATLHAIKQFLIIDPTQLELPIEEPSDYPTFFIHLLKNQILENKNDIRYQHQLSSKLCRYPILLESLSTGFYSKTIKLQNVLHHWIDAAESMQEKRNRQLLKTEFELCVLIEKPMLNLKRSSFSSLPEQLLKEMRVLSRSGLRIEFSQKTVENRELFIQLFSHQLVNEIPRVFERDLDLHVKVIDYPQFSPNRVHDAVLMDEAFLETVATKRAGLFRLYPRRILEDPSSIERIISKSLSTIFFVPSAIKRDALRSRALDRLLVSPSLFLSAEVRELYEQMVIETDREFEQVVRVIDLPEGGISRKKALGQVAGLEGTVQGIALEGDYSEFYAYEIARLIERIPTEKLHLGALRQAFDKAAHVRIPAIEYLREYERGHPILLNSGYSGVDSGHSICVVLWNDHLIICNRGNRNIEDPTMVYHSIDPRKVTVEIIDLILHAKVAYHKESQDLLIYQLLPCLIKKTACSLETLTREVSRKAKIEAAIVCKNQKVGNCSAASLKAAFKALAFLDLYQRIEDQYADEEIRALGIEAKKAADRLSIELRREQEKRVELDPIECKTIYFRSVFKRLKKQLNLIESIEDLKDLCLEKEALMAAHETKVIFFRIQEYRHFLLRLYQKSIDYSHPELQIECERQIREILASGNYTVDKAFGRDNVALISRLGFASP